jgi:hypothetical protein
LAFANPPPSLRWWLVLTVVVGLVPAKRSAPSGPPVAFSAKPTISTPAAVVVRVVGSVRDGAQDSLAILTCRRIFKFTTRGAVAAVL